MGHGDHSAGQFPSDAELVCAARQGDQVSLGQLFMRYRPRLYATALVLVGYRADAEDAVHDTFVTALAHLGDLRDPAAAGGWLHSILRNRCFMDLRRRRPQASPGETAKCFRELPDEARVESRIESQELRDWVWLALARLPEAHRATVMLRYFGSYSTYEELAAILGVPVGTVRSRLSDAKAKLADLLLACAGLGMDESRKTIAERCAFYTEAYRDLSHGGRDRFLSHYTEDLQFLYTTGAMCRGRTYWDHVVDGTVSDGVEVGVTRVLASGDVTVLEGVFHNPADDPFHCPPGAAFVLFHRNDQTYRLHLHHAQRPPGPNN